MTTIIPEGEAIRLAVKWISEKCCENPGSGARKWVNEAGIRFNLSPKEEEYLYHICKEQMTESHNGCG
jgi:hypothetical protein